MTTKQTQDIEKPAIETPCVQICVMDAATGLCQGCSRTRNEIAAWSQLTSAERRRIMLELPSRPQPDR